MIAGIFGIFSNMDWIVEGYDEPQNTVGRGWHYLYGIFLGGILTAAGATSAFFQIRMWKANRYLK